MSDARIASTLVIGYGNTLRRDDALGWLIADEVGRWQRPGVRSLSLAQLTPELAAELAAARTAIFVDALRWSPSAEMKIQVERLWPHGQGGAALVHAITPGVLLRLCQAAFGRCPGACWLVSVPGADFSFGEGLSAMADRGREQALGMIGALLARGDDSEPGRPAENPRVCSSAHCCLGPFRISRPQRP